MATKSTNVTSIETLKTYFKNGEKPTEQEFSKLIDAFVHRSEDLEDLQRTFADETEAKAGTATDKYMNPFLTKTAIEALALVNASFIIGGAPVALNTIAKIATAISNRYTKAEINTKLAGKAASSHDHDNRYYTESEINTKLAGKAASSHNHDNRYYTESEINTKLAGKAASAHDHDNRYYTETEINTKLRGKAASSHDHDSRYFIQEDIRTLLKRYYGILEIDSFFEGNSHGNKKQVSWHSITNKPVGISMSKWVGLPNGRRAELILTNGLITKWTEHD